ncbi:MAG: site-2 protease family protein [Candidatus Omnitrophica bacterium]|nr:site-2 protease family protein [Candidatus Omnitrophota bacterium]
MTFWATLPLFLMSVVLHEVSHGWVAYRLGDSTAKEAGRLTLNPLAHIDFFGTLLLPFLLAAVHSPVVFGWAKPVPVNFLNLYHPKRDMIWVGLVGPLMNLTIAFILSLLLQLGPSGGLSALITVGVLINLVLAVFNLIPIPPLDGSRVLAGLLPPKQAVWLIRLEPFGFLILIPLLWLGLVDRFLWPSVRFLAAFLGVNL